MEPLRRPGGWSGAPQRAFSPGLATLMCGSGMFSARSQPGTPERYARRGWESRGALWELRGISALSLA